MFPAGYIKTKPMKKFPNIPRKCNKDRIFIVGPPNVQVVTARQCPLYLVRYLPLNRFRILSSIVSGFRRRVSRLVFLFVFFVLPLLCLQCIPNCAGD